MHGINVEIPDDEKLEKYAAYYGLTVPFFLDCACGTTTDAVAQGQTTIWKGGTTA